MNIKTFLDEMVEKYNCQDFIKDDPISIPHRFKKKQDIEISGFFAATFAWGQRKTIINKSNELISLMDNSPYDFILNHTTDDLKPFLKFRHRTFNETDTLYFIAFFKDFYSKSDSLEEAFIKGVSPESENLETGISNFNKMFFSLEFSPSRTRKHVSTPDNNSACKRINMYLRWMVRKDLKGVDFGIWSKIKASQLICPCDVHVDRVGRKLGLINRRQTDWKTALELTNQLKTMDPLDPVKYDFALFGLGVMEKF